MSWAEFEDEMGWFLVVIAGSIFLVALFPMALAVYLLRKEEPT